MDLISRQAVLDGIDKYIEKAQSTCTKDDFISFAELGVKALPSAFEGLDLPDDATNEDALNYMLRQTFPKVIFIHFHNEADLTEGVVMSKEWLNSPYKGVSE